MAKHRADDKCTPPSPSTSAADTIGSQLYPRKDILKICPWTKQMRTELNACRACAGSKRKCGRQMPSCARCAARGRSCVYPLRTRPASSSRPLISRAMRGSVPRVEDGLLTEVTGSTSSSTGDLILPDDIRWDIEFPFMNGDFPTPLSLIYTPSAPVVRADWFLAPETWAISQKFDTSADAPIGRVEMKKHVIVLQSWFERWATTGSNPFIHPRLYSANVPACVQVAYATLASYIHRTPANTDTVLQIVEDRSNDLLLENGAILDRVGVEEWADRGEQDVDLFTQLTRLHALMVYQIIGLFDGDIRARHVAEGHIAIQNSWAAKLFHSAAKALSNTQTAAATHLVGCLPRPSTDSQQQWYLWILSESIRRTWLIAASLSPIYVALQQCFAPCPGGVMYTNRSGLWNAASATEWERQCSARSVGFLQRFECDRLLDDAEPADIDEFGTAILDMTFSGELLEKWRDRSGGF